jgi:hypothetical protein
MNQAKPRNARKLSVAIFNDAFTKGSMLMAVCRGKISGVVVAYLTLPFLVGNMRKPCCFNNFKPKFYIFWQKKAYLPPKISEGLDFSDDAARTVIQVGVPFSMLKDPKTILKQRYLNKIKLKMRNCLGGKEWYFLQATRAFNQAIGRAIRHKDDYGHVILIDQRYGIRGFWDKLNIIWVKYLGVLEF